MDYIIDEIRKLIGLPPRTPVIDPIIPDEDPEVPIVRPKPPIVLTKKEEELIRKANSSSIGVDDMEIQRALEKAAYARKKIVPVKPKFIEEPYKEIPYQVPVNPKPIVITPADKKRFFDQIKQTPSGYREQLGKLGAPI